MDGNWIIILTAIAAGGFVLRSVFRRLRSYRCYLARELDQRGCTFIASKPAASFDTGPFPAVEVKMGRPQLKTPFGSGTFTAYRIVTYCDSGGTEHKAWAKIEFEMFRLRKIVWNGLRGKTKKKDFAAINNGFPLRRGWQVAKTSQTGVAD